MPHPDQARHTDLHSSLIVVARISPIEQQSLTSTATHNIETQPRSIPVIPQLPLHPVLSLALLPKPIAGRIQQVVRRHALGLVHEDISQAPRGIFRALGVHVLMLMVKMMRMMRWEVLGQS